MSLVQRLWFNPIAHLIGLVSLGGVFVLLYAQSHRALQDNYENSIRETSKLMFETFALQRSADRTKVVVTMAGNPIGSVEKLPKAPFGLEGLASFQGAVVRQQAIAEQINGFYQRQKDLVLGAFNSIGESSKRIPLRAVGSRADHLESEISREQFDQLSALALDEFTGFGARIIGGGTPYSPTNLPSLTLGNTGNSIVDRGVELAMTHANRIPGSRSGNALPEAVRQEVNAFFQSWPVQTAIHLGGVSNTVARADSTLTLDQLLTSLSDTFAQELQDVAAAETGSFWLLGRYRWWEMIFWVWFGVVVSALIQLAPPLLGSNASGPWEPRETAVVLAKVFYAPILALAVFFMAGQFGLGQFEMQEMGRSSPAILGVAFLLGLFPNTTWRIVRDLCTRLFREDLREGAPPKTPTPAPVTVSTTVSMKDGKPAYTVDDLKRNIGDHALSILKPGEA